MQLGEMERCRKIYERQIQVFSFVSDAWIDYALFESRLGELQRTRFIFEIAIAQEELDMPEHVWKAFIDFEIEQAEQGEAPFDYSNARALYERLIQITKHVNVWVSYAQFECDHPKDFEKARDIYSLAHSHFRTSSPDLKEDRALILSTWYEFECRPEVNGPEATDSERARKLLSQQPKKVKRRRKIETKKKKEGEENEYDDEEDGDEEKKEEEEGWEEYEDLIFPEDRAENKWIENVSKYYEMEF